MAIMRHKQNQGRNQGTKMVIEERSRFNGFNGFNGFIEVSDLYSGKHDELRISRLGEITID
jgi:hypothetical protein